MLAAGSVKSMHAACSQEKTELEQAFDVTPEDAGQLLGSGAFKMSTIDPEPTALKVKGLKRVSFEETGRPSKAARTAGTSKAPAAAGAAVGASRAAGAGTAGAGHDADTCLLEVHAWG